MKIYKIYAPVEHLFDGNSEVFLRVIEETKDKIIGFKTNLKGNNKLSDYEEGKYFEGPMTIIKSNVVGWGELLR